MDINIKPTKLILLTGAGFSKNYDGYLAKELWSKIFNHPDIQKQEKIRQLMLDNFDFEEVWAEVYKDAQYASGGWIALQNAVESSYEDLDENVRNWIFNDDNPTSFFTGGWGELLGLFTGKGQEQGCFFTLNQDLVMERKNGFRPLGAPFAEELHNPGVQFMNKHTVVLPGQDEVEKINNKIESLGDLLYMKLHGSFGWMSPGGKKPFVMGHNKSEQIQKEPLLQYYMDAFEHVIAQGDRKLLIIGYGFRDKHINKVLADGVYSHNLKLLIITTESPEILKITLMGTGEGQVGVNIWNGIKGYFPYTFREIFPPNQNETSTFREIRKALDS